MGKLIVVSGPNESGKSAFAESLMSRIPGQRYYIATMVPQTEENYRRIEKHRLQRADLGFTTLELAHGIDRAPVEAESAVLLEDASNLLANLFFETHGDEKTALAELRELQNRCRVLTVVTISGLRAEQYTGETAEYIRGLDALNAALFRQADAAAELRDGVACWRKGGVDALA